MLEEIQEVREKEVGGDDSHTQVELVLVSGRVIPLNLNAFTVFGNYTLIKSIQQFLSS